MKGTGPSFANSEQILTWNLFTVGKAEVRAHSCKLSTLMRRKCGVIQKLGFIPQSICFSGRDHSKGLVTLEAIALPPFKMNQGKNQGRKG